MENFTFAVELASSRVLAYGIPSEYPHCLLVYSFPGVCVDAKVISCCHEVDSSYERRGPTCKRDREPSLRRKAWMPHFVNYVML